MQDREQTPIFVISSGRTGSTLLAKMIHRHPQLLCVSDIFEPVGEIPYFDRSQKVDGATFFQVLSQASFKQRIAYWRAQSTSELLFLHDDDAMVSLLTSYTLPFLTGGDPMDLYDELKAATAGFGEAPMADHFIRFCDWLRDHYGKDLWIERTGGSLPHTDKIVECWPQAKIVHNFRDSREVAISMMTGSFFRLYLELEKDPDLDKWDWDHMPPIEEMGAMLNGWIVDETKALDAVPDERKMNLRFEDLITETRATLLAFSNFVLDRNEPTPEDIAWAEEQCAVIRKPALKFPTLAEDDQAKLQAVCREGLETLGYA